jgi:hypothetical protein
MSSPASSLCARRQRHTAKTPLRGGDKQGRTEGVFAVILYTWDCRERHPSGAELMPCAMATSAISSFNSSAVGRRHNRRLLTSTVRQMLQYRWGGKRAGERAAGRNRSHATMDGISQRRTVSESALRWLCPEYKGLRVCQRLTRRPSPARSIAVRGNYPQLQSAKRRAAPAAHFIYSRNLFAKTLPYNIVSPDYF